MIIGVWIAIIVTGIVIGRPVARLADRLITGF